MGAVAIVFLILLFLHRFRLRNILIKIISIAFYLITVICALYIINTIDIFPDLIPVLGQVDAAAALIAVLFSGITGTIFAVLGRK